MTVHTPDIKALKLKPEHIFNAMGYKKGQHADEYTAMLTSVLLKEAASKIHPLICIESFEGCIQKDILIINGVIFHPGRTIAEQLDNSTVFYVFAATIGKEYEDWKKEAEKQDDPLQLFIIDAIGSCITERCVTELQHRIRHILPENWGKSLHFSPGYCHWDVSEQQQLFALFPPEFDFVTLTESFLMVPVKSISGIIGTGENVTIRTSPCQICLKKDCFRRIS